jgi:uncharacterized membrane protein YhaH (DUF805 family)
MQPSPGGRDARSSSFFILFEVVALIVAAIIDGILGTNGGVYGLVALGFILPVIAISVRRLHDTDRSGWWYLLVLVPFGAIVLIIWARTKGTSGDNRFGADPTAPVAG